MSACEPFRELYEAYALGALDATERDALEAHLRTGCANCTGAVEEARWLASQLAYLAPEAAPSEMLKARLMRTVRAEAAQAKKARPKPGGIPWWMWAGVTALVLMSVYSAWDARRLEGELRTAREQAATLAREREQMQQARALAERERSIVLDPASVQIVMPAAEKGAGGIRAYWNAKLGIVVAGLQIAGPPSHRSLQLWLVPKAPGSKPLSAGLLEKRPDGSFVVLVKEPPDTMPATKLLAITEEPEGGSPQPTSAPKWAGSVS